MRTRETNKAAIIKKKISVNYWKLTDLNRQHMLIDLIVHIQTHFKV